MRIEHKKRKRIVIVINILAPYRIPLFNYLHNKKSFDFKALILAEKEANREWEVVKEKIKFNYQILPGFHKFIWKEEFPIHINWGLWKALRQYRPDVIVVFGYNAIAYWGAFFYAKFFKKKYIIWNGTTLLSTKRISGLVGKLKRIIINGADSYITYGTKAAKYLAFMGASEEKIYTGINTVDMEWHREKTKEFYRSENFKQERLKYPKLLMLYVGRLVEKKKIMQVLEALDRLKDKEVGFLIVGSGPQEKKLRIFCEQHNLQNVYFKGFRQGESLVKYYALADIFVFPSSYDVWGLVINEALASGLYVLCSNCAGAGYDLIKKEWNGEIFSPYDIEEICGLIKKAKINIKQIRDKRDLISLRACQNFSISHYAKIFCDAVQSIN